MGMTPGYIPTEEQIRRDAETIRASWSPSERRRRHVGYLPVTVQEGRIVEMIISTRDMEESVARARILRERGEV